MKSQPPSLAYSSASQFQFNWFITPKAGGMCFVYVEFSGLSHDSHSDGFSYLKPTTASEGLSLLDYIPQIDCRIRYIRWNLTHENKVHFAQMVSDGPSDTTNYIHFISNFLGGINLKIGFSV